MWDMTHYDYDDTKYDKAYKYHMVLFLKLIFAQPFSRITTCPILVIIFTKWTTLSPSPYLRVAAIQ